MWPTLSSNIVREVINLEAAALIAQVYPVGVLLLLLEARAIQLSKPKKRWPLWRKLALAIIGWVMVAVSAAAIVTATISVAMCVASVAFSEELTGGYAAWVAASGLLMMTAVGMYSAGIFMSRATPRLRIPG